MKPEKTEDRISQIMNDPEKVREAIQSALMMHYSCINKLAILSADGKR